MDINNFEVCPFSNLSVTTRKEWTNIKLGTDYKVTFSIIGDNIFHVAAFGTPTGEEFIKMVEIHDRILKENGLFEKPYLELRDYKGLSARISNPARMAMANFVMRERDRGFMLGLLVYRMPLIVKWCFNVGVKMFGSHIPIECVDSYAVAITESIKIFDGAGIDVIKTVNHVDFMNEWNVECDSSVLIFKQMGPEHLYLELKGPVGPDVITSFFLNYKKMLGKLNLTERRYHFLVINVKDVEKIRWKDEVFFYSKLKEVNNKNHKVVPIVLGLGFFERIVARIFSRVGLFPVNIFADQKRSSDFIEKKRRKILFEKVDKKCDKVSKDDSNCENFGKYRDEFLEFIGSISWDMVDGIAKKQVGSDHPFSELYDAMSIVKEDFDLMLLDKKSAIEGLRESEERFRIMFESTHELMSIHEISGKTIWVNNAWTNALGYNVDEEKLYQNKVHQKNRVKYDDLWSLMVNEGAEINELEYRYKNAWNDYVLLNSTMKLLKTSRQAFCFVVSRDITVAKMAEKDKENMQKQISQSAKLASIGELAAGVAHEINNPLAIIRGHVEHMGDMLNGEEPYLGDIKTSLRKQEKSVDRIKNIVNGLRTYARSDSDHNEVIDINKLVSDTVDIISVIYEKAEVPIEMELSEKKLFVMGNIGKFQQVIMNLLSNAKDAMEDISGKIKIKTEDFGNLISLKISDSGTGIKPDDLAKIFETFYTSKGVGKGTGLGLSISQSIIDGMGGRVEVDSVFGKGTTFTITLPGTENRPLQNDPFGEKQNVTEFEELNGRVLVVDDEEDIREILVFYLEEFGFTVSEACDGKVALEKINEVDGSYYDFIITDLQMPRMGGDILISEIKKLSQVDAIILVLTGGIATRYSEGRRKVLREHVDGYIGKPFSKSDIYEILRSKLRDNGTKS